MSKASATLTTHSLNEGDVVFFVCKKGRDEISMTFFVQAVDPLRKFVTGSMVSLIEEDDEYQPTPMEYGEWEPQDHDYEDARVYMVSSVHHEMFVTPEDGKSIYCGFRKIRATDFVPGETVEIKTENWEEDQDNRYTYVISDVLDDVVTGMVTQRNKVDIEPFYAEIHEDEMNEVFIDIIQ